MSGQPLVVMGVDPGSRITGYAIIAQQQQQFELLTCGQIAVSGDFVQRLVDIADQLDALVAQYMPHECAIEEVFVHKNVQSALKLGQARGAALATIGRRGIAVASYTPRQVKQAVVGYGAAQKGQVQAMVAMLLKLAEAPSEDAADACALALCHCQSRRFARRIAEGSK